MLQLSEVGHGEVGLPDFNSIFQRTIFDVGLHSSLISVSELDDHFELGHMFQPLTSVSASFIFGERNFEFTSRLLKLQVSLRGINVHLEMFSVFAGIVF